MVRKDKEIFLDMSFWSVNKQKRVRVFDAYCILFNLRFFINLLLLVFRKHRIVATRCCWKYFPCRYFRPGNLRCEVECRSGFSTGKKDFSDIV